MALNDPKFSEMDTNRDDTKPPEIIIFLLCTAILVMWVFCCCTGWSPQTQSQLLVGDGQRNINGIQNTILSNCGINNDCPHRVNHMHLERGPSSDDLPPKYEEVMGLLCPKPQYVYEQSTEQILPVQLIRETTL